MLRFVRARAHVRALMTRKSCAVGMRNAIPRNYLKYKPNPVYVSHKRNCWNNNLLESLGIILHLLFFQHRLSSNINRFLQQTARREKLQQFRLLILIDVLKMSL